METITLDTLAKLDHHGHGLFGWCLDCGSPSRYWDNVKARRTPKPAMFDVDLAALIRERGAESLVVELAPIPCPRCGSNKDRNARHHAGKTSASQFYFVTNLSSCSSFKPPEPPLRDGQNTYQDR